METSPNSRKRLIEVYYKDFNNYNDIDAKFEDVYDWHHQELQKAREEERERCVAIVKEYGVKMSALQQELIGTAHDDCKQMLAYDMHSRLIAVKHITEKLSNPS
jgi:hypothetical protein